MPPLPDLVAAITPVLDGTAFDVPVQAGPTSLLWCATTSDFRDRHPTVTEAVDHDHLDGCTDLTVEVDERGRLHRLTIELLDLGDGLAGRPVEAALPEVVERLAALLR